MSESLAPKISHQHTFNWRALYLTLVSIASLFSIAYFLSSFQVYQRINSVRIGDEMLSVHRLLRLQEDTEVRDRGLDLKRDAILDEQQKLKGIDEKLSLHKSQQNDIEMKHDDVIDLIADETKIIELKNLEGDYYDRQTRLKGLTEKVDPNLASLKAYSTFDRDNKPKFDALIVKEQSERDKRRDVLKKINGLNNEANALLTEKRTFDNKVDPKFQEAVMDLVDELRQPFLRNYFLVLPELVIAIVIFGGFLGSAVFLTFDYAEETPQKSLTYYSLRFLGGALTSLLLFIVIKAGVIVAIDTKTLELTNAQLNPFFVAFIGVVGGLISNQVVAKIIAYANSWFSSAASGKERYAMDAAISELADPKKVSDFLRLSGYAPEALERWVTERGLVSPDAQRAVSLFLNRDPRLLFTDMPPPPPEVAKQGG